VNESELKALLPPERALPVARARAMEERPMSEIDRGRRPAAGRPQLADPDEDTRPGVRDDAPDGHVIRPIRGAGRGRRRLAVAAVLVVVAGAGIGGALAVRDKDDATVTGAVG
jgi:hypothetical protein